MKYNFLRDCLANLSERNNTPDMIVQNKEYYRGLLVGVVSALMMNYQTDNFHKACTKVIENLPKDCIPLDDILPECWQDEFTKFLKG